MDMPEVQFAHSGGVAIAYQVLGEGPQALVYVPPVTNLYSLWEQPRAESFLRRLAEDAQVAVLNPRGAGLWDRPPRMTLESRMDDINAVMDTVGSEQATIFGGRCVHERVRSLCGHVPGALRSTCPLHAARACGPLRLPPIRAS